MFWGVDLVSFVLLQFLLSHCKELELQKQAKQMLEEIRFFAVIGQSLGQFSLSKIGADGLNTQNRSKIWWRVLN